MSSKLFNLKRWLTLADAAKHLSIAFGEDVTEADVLYLALDGRLRLSVNFVNGTTALSGKVAHYTEAELVAAIASGNLPEDLKWRVAPPGMLAALNPDWPPEQTEKELITLASLKIGPDCYVTLDDDVTTIWEIWDLPMIGNERLDVEHHYQRLTGGPAVTAVDSGGTFVERPDGPTCQLQTSNDDNEFQAGSMAQEKGLQRLIAAKLIPESDVEEILRQHNTNRKIFLEERKLAPKSEGYFPAGGLPPDSVLVVRTAALRDFEQAISETPVKAERPLATRERNTLLTIIAALCDYSDIKHRERGAAVAVAKMTEELGAPVTGDTIRTVLAKIPSALESRMK